MKKSKLVRIEWRDPRDDWQWFHLLGMRGEWLKLRGADYPDGSAKHDGDCFWVHRIEVLRMHAEKSGKKTARGLAVKTNGGCQVERRDYSTCGQAGAREESRGGYLRMPEDTKMTEEFCIVDRDLDRYLGDEDAATRLHERVLEEMAEILNGEPILSEMMAGLQPYQRAELDDMLYQLAEVRIKTRDGDAELNRLLDGME